MSRFSLEGKTAIITGGAGGLGRSMVEAYADAGANVVIASRSRDKIEAEAAKINAKGQRAIAIAVDITDEEQVHAMVSETVETFGALDIMVNNAGRWGRSHLAEETPLDEWRELVDQNLTGVFIPCMAAGKQMIKQGSGKIINVSSTAGTKGNPGMIHYSAAKAGVLSLTNNLAYMWAEHNICVNAVVPGLVATPAMIAYGVTPPEIDGDGNPTPRLSRAPGPEDVAALCRYLASPAADMITGEAIPVRAWNKIDRFWE